ncbi:MAG: hypothetical protein CM15mP83_2840 [Flavobacteriaceae bacterium]|nr:MAG: hypothetical protein CM15mP83_2840 [Flavobacteriaceae bacterium]
MVDWLVRSVDVMLLLLPFNSEASVGVAYSLSLISNIQWFLDAITRYIKVTSLSCFCMINTLM